VVCPVLLLTPWLSPVPDLPYGSDRGSALTGSFISNRFLARGLLIALTMEAVGTSETLVNLYHSTRRYNPEHSHLYPSSNNFHTLILQESNYANATRASFSWMLYTKKRVPKQTPKVVQVLCGSERTTASLNSIK
jgi:hypothetical protein